MILTVKISDQAASALIECPIDGCSYKKINNSHFTRDMIKHFISSRHRLDGKELETAILKINPNYKPRADSKRRRDSDASDDQRYLVQSFLLSLARYLTLATTSQHPIPNPNL